jgi:hypothetical protein
MAATSDTRRERVQRSDGQLLRRAAQSECSATLQVLVSDVRYGHPTAVLASAAHALRAALEEQRVPPAAGGDFVAWNRHHHGLNIVELRSLDSDL